MDTKDIYVVTRMTLDKDVDVEEVVGECDYWFQYEDKIKRTEITDYWHAREVTDGA